MFEIVFLGTSASAPSIHRGLPALAVLAGEHRFLVDCGEGTQRQILKSGLGYRKLNRVLLTHHHLDHILGLGGLVSTFAHWEDIHDIEIFGGKPSLDRVQRLLFGVVLDFDRIDMQIHLVDLKPGVFLRGSGFNVSAFPVTHRGPGCFGFTFQEHAHRPFLVERAAALGVPAGPERGQLVAGHSVTLADGRVIAPDDVLGETEPGVKLCVIADTSRTDNLIEHVQGANLLVIEATFLQDAADNANRWGHLTAQQAATLALEANVEVLVLHHISRRYTESAVLAEARAIFPNTYVARDFDHFATRRGQPARRLPKPQPTFSQQEPNTP